jgi:hypothetical protein
VTGLVPAGSNYTQPKRAARWRDFFFSALTAFV